MKTAYALLTLIALFFSSVALAAEPFGLKIGEMTLTEFDETQEAQDGGLNRWSGGPMRIIEPDTLPIKGAENALAIFDENKILVGLIVTLQKSRFDEINQMASTNYDLISSDVPFVGDKTVRYTDKDTEIKILAPHMSFSMELQFLHNSLISAHESGREEEKNEQAKQESSALFGGDQ